MRLKMRTPKYVATGKFECYICHGTKMHPDYPGPCDHCTGLGYVIRYEKINEEVNHEESQVLVLP